MLLAAPALAGIGVPHGFSTRAGGVSAGPFASLNFGNPGGLEPSRRDPPANIAENFRRVLASLGTPGRRIVQVHQVHGATVHAVRRGEPDHPGPADTHADAIVTDDPARLVAVRVADCAPVLLASRDGRVVAAVHAGWRGVVAGVLPATIRVMREAFGAGDLRAAIGPCIGMERFQVGPEVAREFEALFGRDERIVRDDLGAPGKHLVSLRAALERQARAAGVGIVEQIGGCTASEARFFSHRRDAGVTGRMVAIIGPRG